MAYAFYMGHVFVSRNLYLATLLLYISFSFLEILYKRKTRYFFVKQSLMALSIVVVFFLISIIIQAKNGVFASYLYVELLYFVIPPLLAFLFVNTLKNIDFQILLVIIFMKMVVYFLLKFGGDISLNNILQINFFDSKSSAFEVVIAHDFFILSLIFLYFKSLRLALLSFFFCFLSFKRLPYLLSLIILVLYLVQKYNLILITQRFGKRFRVFIEQEASNYFVAVVVGGMLFAYFAMNWLYSDSGILWFYDTFGEELNKFATGRPDIVRYVMEHCMFNGLGSSTAFMKGLPGAFGILGSMHCDVLRLPYEITVYGFAFYIFTVSKIFKVNNFTMLLLCYFFLEMIISHFADNLNAWIVIYLLVAYQYKEQLLELDEKQIK